MLLNEHPPRPNRVATHPLKFSTTPVHVKSKNIPRLILVLHGHVLGVHASSGKKSVDFTPPGALSKLAGSRGAKSRQLVPSESGFLLGREVE